MVLDGHGRGEAASVSCGLRLLLLLGAREREVGEMEWREMVGDAWTIPGARNKSGEDHTLPLRAMVKAELAKLERRTPYVLPSLLSKRVDKPIGRMCEDGGAKWVLKRMKEIAAKERGEPVEIEEFVPHSLRHTVETWMAELGVPGEWRDAVLNHSREKSRSSGKTYNHARYARAKVYALDTWEEALGRVINGQPLVLDDDGATVLPLRAVGMHW